MIAFSPGQIVRTKDGRLVSVRIRRGYESASGYTVEPRNLPGRYVTFPVTDVVENLSPAPEVLELKYLSGGGLPSCGLLLKSVERADGSVFVFLELEVAGRPNVDKVIQHATGYPEPTERQIESGCDADNVLLIMREKFETQRALLESLHTR